MEKHNLITSIQEQLTTLINTVTIYKDKNSAKSGLNFTRNDAILYALGVGVSMDQSDYLRFLYELSDDFKVLPTFATIVASNAIMEKLGFHDSLNLMQIKLDFTKLVQCDHYLEIIKTIPSSGKLISETRIEEVSNQNNKGKIVISVDTTDDNGKLLFYNKLSFSLKEYANTERKRKNSKGLINNAIKKNEREPDVIVIEQTNTNQALIFRLICGDKNPIHIDPTFAYVKGFQKPILHNLCSLGYSFRHVLNEYADNDVNLVQRVHAKFSAHIHPGQTIQTNMWKDDTKVCFQSLVKETEKCIISEAYVDFYKIPTNKTQIISAINLYTTFNSRFESHNSEQNPSNIDGLQLEKKNTFNNIEPEIIQTYTIGSIITTPNNLVQNKANIICLTDEKFQSWVKDLIIKNKDLGEFKKTTYKWNITMNGEIVSVWTLELEKGKEKVYKGLPKSGKADCTLTINEDYAIEVFERNANVIIGFNTGKICITGNVVAANKLQELWRELPIKPTTCYAND